MSLFFQFSVVQVLVGLRKQFINNFVFPTWVCSAGLNNNNNNNALKSQLTFNSLTNHSNNAVPS